MSLIDSDHWGNVSGLRRSGVRGRSFLVFLSAALFAAGLTPVVTSASAQVVAPPGSTATQATSMRAGSHAGSLGSPSSKRLAGSPSSLRKAVRRTWSTGHELTASYTHAGATFAGADFQLVVGAGSLGRGAAIRPTHTSFAHRSWGVVYRSSRVTESFQPVQSGIEQVFRVARRPLGGGPLTVHVPVSGLSAVTVGRAIDLRDREGRTRATYSGLLVTDASGRKIPAEMHASSGGNSIEIEVRDSTARYPLTVDPVWTEVDKLVASDQTNSYEFGRSMAVSGTTAVVGAQQVDGSGAAYVFSKENGSWTQTAKLTASDGASGDAFGWDVAISGSTIVVVAPWHGNVDGEGGEVTVYVFASTGGDWSQAAELTGSDHPGGGLIGPGTSPSLAFDGTTIAVGVPSQKATGYTWNNQGAVYLFASDNGSWTQTAKLTAPNLTAGSGNNYFGSDVALSSGTLVIGEQGGDHHVNVDNPAGNAFIYSGSGGSWSQTAELTPSDGTDGDGFGFSVSLSGSTIVVGAPFQTVSGNGSAGDAYVFSLSNGSWTQTAELTASDSRARAEFGFSTAISGSTVVVGAPCDDALCGTVTGAAYVFKSSGGSWPQTTELTGSDAGYGDSFGFAVLVSQTNIIVGAPDEPFRPNLDRFGAAYVFSLLAVQPEGSPVGPDARSGGSPSEPCQCGTSVADPINAANGDYHEAVTDLRLPGGGLPLHFTRTYDVQAAQAEATAGSPAPPFGYGWTNNFDMNVSYDSGTQVATITEENGAQVTYAPYVSGTSPAWCSTSQNFCATAPRMAATLNQNSDGTWTFSRAARGTETFTFDATGVLEAIADSTGATISSAPYTPTSGQAGCPTGDTCVAWTSSASGRELVLATNVTGQLDSAFDATGALTAQFSYSGANCDGWSAGQTPELCTATDPGGITSRYRYDSGNPSAVFDYNMTSATTPGSSGATVNLYDTQGRVVQQTDPSGAVTTLSYAGTNASYDGGSTTVTTYPLGTGTGKPQNTTVYTFSSNVLVQKTVGVGTEFASTSLYERDPVSLGALTSTDANRHGTSFTYQTYSGAAGTPTSSANVLTATDPVGNTTQYAYTAHNLIWCVVDSADYANGARCPSSPPTSPPTPGAADPNAGMTVSFYDSADHLTARTDALGNTTTYAYTANGSGVPVGLRYCTVAPTAYENGVSCPAYGGAHVAGTTTVAYDSAGDRVNSTDPDGHSTTYAYTDSAHPGRVSSMTDPDGTTTAFTYDGSGHVAVQTVSFAGYTATTLYGYDSTGRRFCQVDPYEQAKGITCPANAPDSPPTPGNDPYLGATITSYDPNGRVVQTTNPVGGVTYTAYDSAGEKFCTVAPRQALNGVTCPSTAPVSPPTIGNDPYLGATITSYDPQGRVTQVTNPLGGITLTSYDNAGNITETTVESNNATDAPDIVTTNGYDAANRLTSITIAAGSSLARTSKNAYNPNGDVFCSASPNAVGSGNYQCPTWQPDWITAPPNPADLYSTNPTPAQANNVQTTFADANGRQVQSTDPDVHTTISAIDRDGRAYCTADAVNFALWIQANPSSNYPYLCPTSPPTSPPAQGSHPGYRTTIYDAAGRVTSTTDELGDTTHTSYDPAGHVLSVTDPRGKITTNCYYTQNATGQCAANAPTDGGSGDDLYSTTTPATAADPTGEKTTFTYYPGGQTHVTTTPAGATTIDYDANENPTSVTYGNTVSGYATPANLTFSYYVDGARHTMADGTGTTTYTLDSAGNLTQQAFTASGNGLQDSTMSYAYFTSGALKSVSYPSYGSYSNPTASYAYDATGAMTSVTDWLNKQITFTHDANGNATSQNNAVTTSNPNGTSSTTFSYDAADQNTSAISTIAQTCGGNETLTQSFSGAGGSRNADGQLTADSETYAGSCSGQAAHTRAYSYDQAGRVTYQGVSAQGANPDSFGYDPAGDATTFSAHDAAGNFDTYSQTYDSAGEVTSQTPTAGSQGATTTFTYDTLGDQTKAITGSTTTTYGFDQVGHMTDASQSSGTTTYQYTGDGLVAAATTTPSWKTPAQVDPSRSITGVSCATATKCVAVDSVGGALTYNGESWSPATSIDGSNALAGVSCPTTSFCVAVDGKGNALTYNGTTWSSATVIDAHNSLSAVSCPSSSFCAASDTTGNVLTYNGVTWSAATNVDGRNSINGISCASSTFCIAVDAKGNAITYNGTTWSAATSIDSTRVLKSVSCPTNTFCAAVDASGYTVKRTGTTWNSPTNVDGTTSINAVACISSSWCKAVDNTGRALHYDGTGWSAATSIDSTRAIKGVSCASTGFCAAGDATGYSVLFQGPATQFTWNATAALPIVASDGNDHYIYGPSATPVEQVRKSSGTVTYLTYTSTDSSWLATDSGGHQTGFWRYDAYGTLAYGTPASAFGYAGEYADAPSGLSNLRARWYQPAGGTFTTRDPAFASTDTAYTYAGADPVNSSDSTGLMNLDPPDLSPVQLPTLLTSAACSAPQPTTTYSVASTSTTYTIYDPDPAVKALYDAAFGWYHHGNPVPGVDWFMNGGLKAPTDAIPGTTVAVVETIWFDNESFGQLPLEDVYDIIESDDPSFIWYRNQLVGLLGSKVIDAYIKATVIMTPSGPASLTAKMLEALLGSPV